MKSIVVAFLFLAQISATFAQYSFYNIKSSDMQMSDSNFRRYATPQIKSIVNEYFYLLKKVSPESEPVINIRKSLRQLYLNSVELDKACDLRGIEEDSKCEPRIIEFSKMLKSYESRLYTEVSKFKFIESRIDDSLVFQALLNKLVLSNAKVNHRFDEFKMLRETDFQRYSVTPLEIEKAVKHSLETIDLELNLLVPLPYRVEYDNVWSSFIKALEQRVIEVSDKNYLLDNLERLNIDWNSFHKNMTKGNYEIPLANVKVTSLMHNRWNSILKLILRR